ncbi:MAG: divergent polysaccharide deacetylase family protein [Desulfotignum sp.]
MAIKKKASKKPTAAKTATGKKKTAKTAPKKPAPKTKKTASSTKQGRKKKAVDMVSQLKKVAIGVLVLSAVCLTAAMIADMLLRPTAPVKQKTQKIADKSPASADRQKSYGQDTPSPVYEDISDLPPKKPQSGLMEKNGHPILYEVFEGLGDIRKEPSAVPLPPEDDSIRIALIIDDIGYDKKIAMDLHALEPNISFSVLPWSPFGRVISGMLEDRGAEIMLHLPMEPVEYPEVNPGPGALLASMPPDVLIAQLEKNMMDISGISGVNNHMGSMLTTQANQMNQIFTILKKRNLFFIDSRTAKHSQCRASARLLQIRFAERDVFLDNFQDVAYISGQFAQLKKIAEKHGTAIGIGHPYPATLETLKNELPKLKGKMKIIRASQVATIPG